ncbi:MAG: long-chain fatty acid--CoA ligase [Desulfomicrobium sp.]|nr:long-chain fatty acid--CoA ligase [Pseudomonadota bacterium]MBV1711525.1 long-chain fatty acid--CoA ligase [Desulfomicrobium sp.]MBU4572938.1 long-chain fatty acid--CoA ligase [Pseudomonadota bacterium]MBU4594666.1 long-chain fatty acid--CoA ligase [Pseudomonadota bacterium]MBV1718802.1 long-chain fatty acid--CoA ligase [Desulfomicrobium sp.]
MIAEGISRVWLKHYDQEVSPNLDYEIIPLFEILERTAQNYPDRPAIVFNNWTVSYKKLKRLVDLTAANLKKSGVKPGERVAIMLPNCPQAVISYWACLKIGAVVVMTNPLYMEKELVHHFNDSEARTLITLNLLWKRINGLKDKLHLKRIFVTSIADCLRFPLNILYSIKSKREYKLGPIPYDGKTVLPWKGLLARANIESAHPVDPVKDLAALQYTGGTTGVSKGVMLTHANLGYNAQQAKAVLHTIKETGEIMLGLLPFFHIYGLTVCVNFGTLIGATLVPMPKFVPLDVLKTIHKKRPTIFPCAPSIFIALLQQKNLEKYDLSSVRYCVSGSAPMPVPVMEKFNSLSSGANIVEGFGLTEAAPITHLNPLRGNSKNGSIGLPFPDTDAAIVDMEVGSVPLPAGKIGEMVVRGPQVMQGYWNRPDETASVLRNGWLYTGDIAYMDEEGYFFIVDRKKDLIITGGFNVYPREIDEVLHEHPAVKEAVSVGITHPTRGEIIKAYIVLKEGETLTKTEVIAFCREKLANYKVPKQVEFRDDLPKSIVGKVLRRVIREEEDKRRSDGGADVEDIEPNGDVDGLEQSPKRDKRGRKSKNDGPDES